MTRNAALLAALILSSCAALPKERVGEPSAQEPTYTFVGLGIVVVPPDRELPQDTDRLMHVRDCGTAEDFCMTGPSLSLTMPKDCSRITDGGIYGQGESRTEIVWFDDFGPLTLHSPRYYFWVANPAHPSMVFSYTYGQGFNSLVRGPGGRELLSDARSGRLSLGFRIGGIEVRGVRTGRSSPEPMWRCTQLSPHEAQSTR